MILSGTAAAALLAREPAALAQDCSPSRIQQLKHECIERLRAADNTRRSGDNAHAAGVAKAKEALTEGTKCLKGAFDILRAAFTYCNPPSPGLNPAKCVKEVAKIPKTVKACRAAYPLTQDSIRLMREAEVLHGAAEVEFSDSGGDEIADELRACGETACYETAVALSEYARDVEDAEGALKTCETDNGNSEEFPRKSQPTLEGPANGPPTITID